MLNISESHIVYPRYVNTVKYWRVRLWGALGLIIVFFLSVWSEAGNRAYAS
jgi:hypothetical protein